MPDLQAAARFYEAALGLKLERVLDGDVAELTGAESTIYLLKKDAGTRASPAGPDTRAYDRHWTPVHPDFVVQDLEAAVERALAAGATRESGCVEWLGSRCVSFADPFGNGFCLIAFGHGGYREP